MYTLGVTGLRFTWDPRKSTANRAKHGVSFEEARTAFYDPAALVIPDPEHSEAEERFVLLGLSSRLRLVVVVHCFRASADEIRLISARRATKAEQRQYVARSP
jgi:uncharacterized DUF497 family protein